MIFFLINRFRRKKLRARENRQTAEDQRSIVGSIGYIAGNMGYMEGNLSSMDYTYGGAATHYPLWKPPSGYFPRGEAPPPYDEAVAISQAEALSAQCAAAAAAAQVAATQRATMGMNSVEMQTADLNRRAQVNQMQQIQHHQQPQQSHVPMNHQTAHVVPTLQTHVLAPQAQSNSQSHQITQSTTNLINININSGGNITTIATGENHQPPYSLQDETNTGAALMQGQQAGAIAAQQMQIQHQQQHQQQQQQQIIAAATSTCGNVVGNNANSGRVHIAQSNSICVQTMTPMVSQQQLQQQQQQQQLQQQIPVPQQPSTTQSVLQPAQIMTSTLAANSSTASMSRHQQPGNTQNVTTNPNDCGYKNCHLNGANIAASTVSRRLQRPSEQLQQYVVDVEVNVSNGSSRGYHSLPPCSNPATGDMEVIASPTQFGNTSPSLTSAISTPAIDVDAPNTTNELSSCSAPNTDNFLQMANAGHNTLPIQHSQSNKASSSTGGMKTSSSSSSSASSKRYHRTMPRYYAVADPLSQNLSVASTKTKSEAKMSVNSSANSNASSSTSSNASSSNKKPTCQCPVQHVPMSYMGSTQLNNAQNATNNAFFTVLSNKLNTSSSASNSPSPSQHSSSRLQPNSNTNSLSYQQRPKSSQSSSSTDNNMVNYASNSTSKRSSNATHCNYEGKIATISSGELINSSSTAVGNQQQQQHHHHSHSHSHHGHGHHSSLLLPPQHHDDSSPIVLGRVTKRSSSSGGDRLRSASSGSTRSSIVEGATITSPAAAAYLNSKVDAYLSFTHGTATNHHLKAYNNDIMNPALPPKLHKSLTNLKSSSSSANSSHHTHNNTNVVGTGQQTNTTHRNSSHKTNDLNTNSNNSNTTSTNTNTVLNCNNTSSFSNTNSNNYPSTSSFIAAAATATNCSSSSTTSVQTIYTLSKPSTSSSSTASAAASIIGLTTCTPSTTPSNRSNKDHHDHIMKIQPPSLTLPLSTTSTTSSFTSSTSKINTSTFYPLQNNVTYTLPKNVGGGKMSLNSTINSVVSKVPSVISLPPTGTEHNNIMNNNNGYGYGYNTGGLSSGDNSYNSHQYLNEMNGTPSTTSKSTTLPKILRSKRDLHNSNSNTPSNINCNPNISSSSNYAVSQCSMPAYPKQYAASSGAPSSAHSSTHHQQQQLPTNINNMQTQTITSTLAVNYCPEDSHLNTHSISNSSSGINAASVYSSSSPTSSKQLPVCTTSKNCLNPKEHFLPNDTSLDDDYLSECENCKIAQSSKYYLNAEALTSVGGPQETMTLQRKSLEECKEDPETGYYRISHTLPTNSKKNAPVKNNNRDQWFSTIPAASSSSEEDINE